MVNRLPRVLLLSVNFAQLSSIDKHAGIGREI
jgi:hypothetical protein